MPRNVLLLLLDDDTTAGQVAELAKRIGWKVEHARCVESGMSVTTKIATQDCNNPTTILVFVDLALALTNADLRKLDKHLRVREGLLEKYLSQDALEDINVTNLEQIKEKLHTVDKSIRPLVSMDGGRKFLEENKEFVRAWKIVIFSECDQVSLRKPITEMLGDGLIAWLHKTAPMEKIRSILENNYTRGKQ